MIEYKRYLKVALKLKQPTEEQKKGVINVIDGVNFEWKEQEQGWELLNSVIFKPKMYYEMFCRTCKECCDHIINKEADKVKCKKCGTVTDLNL